METSNIFIIIATITTATRGPIERTTIGGTVDIISITTITITIITTITTILITIDTIYATTITISVIDKITSDTEAGVSEFMISGIRA